MKIIEKNEGKKIGYELMGTRLFLGDWELMIDLSKYQKDDPVSIDVCHDANGNLTMGTERGLTYVAQVDIPKAEYDFTGCETGAGENGQGNSPVRLPLDTDEVTLTLWAI